MLKQKSKFDFMESKRNTIFSGSPDQTIPPKKSYRAKRAFISLLASNISYIMSKLLALCSAVRKFFYTDKRSGTTVTEEKIKGEYEPQASSKPSGMILGRDYHEVQSCESLELEDLFPELFQEPHLSAAEERYRRRVRQLGIENLSQEDQLEYISKCSNLPKLE